ncbi:MAG: hypothetical protein RB294_06040 [Bacteroidales bacterium]|jgi:hypothetical protein|nr:hypothetical protein [Bacteroidales bacterium]
METITKEQADKQSILNNVDSQKREIAISGMPQIEYCIIHCEQIQKEQMQISGTDSFQIVPVKIIADLITKHGDRIKDVTIDLKDIVMFDGINWK